MDTEMLRRYADLLIRFGLNLQKGQLLYIEADLEAKDFVLLVARQALEAGGGDVAVNWRSTALDALRISAPGCTLNTGAEAARVDWLIGQNAACLRLDSPDLTAFAGLNLLAGRIAELAAGEGEVRRRFRTRGKAQNTIACAATPAWAQALFPALPAGEALDRLWRALLGATLADAPDPVAVWREEIARIERRKAWLNEKQYARLWCKSTGTDLTVGLPVGHRWDGGGVTTPEGLFFMPNLPSYEVFTSPLRVQADGVVAATLPLYYSGGLIDDFTLRFADGRVTALQAGQGEALLRSITRHDEGAQRLGEVALVEHGSPVCRQGMVFCSTVCDENAACHLALGSGFCRQGSQAALEQGINVSGLHVDFMFGDAGMCVRGQNGQGEWEDILLEGSWVI